MRGQVSVVSGQRLAVLSVLFVPFVSPAALFIPQTSQLTLQNEPLAKGEAAYVESETPGYARLYVGGDNGGAMRVEDAATVHGYEYEYVDRTKATIIAGDGITYNGSNDRYTANSATGTYSLVIMIPPDYTIDALEYTEYAAYNDMVDISNGHISHVINGNTATITMQREESRGDMYVQNIKIRRVLAGNAEEVNDLTKLEFTLLDDEGGYEWRSLRTWVKHLYDYNRGENWARYKAERRANLNGKGLQLSANNRFAIETAETQTVFRAAAHDAIVVKATGTGEGYEGAFNPTGIRPFDGGVYIPFSYDITGFDPSALVIRGATNLTDCATNNWTSMPFTYATNIITVACSPAYRFFQAVYNGTIIDTAEVAVNVPLKINSALYLKGEDNIVYQITVSGGVISATAVNQ